MLDVSVPEQKAVLNEIEDWVSTRTGGITWTAALRKEDKFFSHHHQSRPCYGEMRRYGTGSTRPNDYHPGDLPSQIKVCDERMAVGVFMPIEKDDPRQPMFDMFFDPKGPWKDGFDFDNFEWVSSKNREINGFVMNSGNFKPTVLVNALIQLRNYFIFGGRESVKQIQAQADKLKVSFRTSYLLNLYISTSGYINYMPHSYTFHNGSDPRRVLKGDSIDLDEGKTWGQLADYNRPEIMKIFYDGNEERKTGYPMFFKKNLLGQDISIQEKNKITEEFRESLAQHLVEIENTLDES